MTPHTVVLAAALIALLCLTCALLRSQGEVLRRAWVRRGRLDGTLLRVLDRGLAGAVVERAVGACGCGMGSRMESWPAIEQVVAELRRLDRVRCAGEPGLWAAAIERAYDRWLQAACHYLAISHRLFALADIDRDIERLRIEEELTAAGLAIRG
jgi:hypothetical protein